MRSLTGWTAPLYHQYARTSFPTNLASAPEAADWLEITLEGVLRLIRRMSVTSMVNRAVKQERQREATANPPPIPTGTYTVILADPPWQYDFAESSTREIENQYPTLPVTRFAACQ